MKKCFEMNAKYSYNPIYSSNFVNFSFINAKIGVKIDFLMLYLYLQTLLVAPFVERVCNKVRIEYTLRKIKIHYKPT
jgi:hypothetical protein